MIEQASGNHYPEGAHAPATVRISAQKDKHGNMLWEDNPFWQGFQFSTRTKKTIVNEEGMVMVNTSTGMVEGTAAITRVFEVDSDYFVKLYTRHLEVFFDLPMVGLMLFEYVLKEAGRQPNKDLLFIHPKDAEKYHKAKGKGFGRASYHRGLNFLIEKGILARSDKVGWLWINPALFWNGDRVKFITEIKRAPEILDPVKGGGDMDLSA